MSITSIKRAVTANYFMAWQFVISQNGILNLKFEEKEGLKMSTGLQRKSKKLVDDDIFPHPTFN